jgi:Icc protein
VTVTGSHCCEGRPVRLLQITDTHLFADPGGRLLGVDTLATLDAVIALAERDGPAFDAVLATGDMVHDGSPEGYDRLCERLSRFGCPVYGLPGNHDAPERMRQKMSRAPFQYLGTATHGDWQIVLLDSTVPGEDGGALSDAELARLDQTLGARASAHALVCLHHAPQSVGSAWIDTMVLRNGDALLRTVGRHPKVRGLVFGHIHQDYSVERDGVRLLAAPSTCVQFAPRQPRFTVDLEPPGYRRITLLSDGTIETAVRRLDGTPAAIDRAARGY